MLFHTDFRLDSSSLPHGDVLVRTWNISDYSIGEQCRLFEPRARLFARNAMESESSRSGSCSLFCHLSRLCTHRCNIKIIMWRVRKAKIFFLKAQPPALQGETHVL